MRTHRQYLDEQIQKDPTFAEAFVKAEQEAALVVERAMLRERSKGSDTE